jgi:Tfp pilus assembly protein PilN
VIRINLLPYEDRPRPRSLPLPDRTSLIIYAAAALIVAAGIYTFFSQGHTLRSLAAKRVELNAEQERLERQTRAIEQLETQSALLSERLDLLRQLEVHRFENVEWLNSVNTVVPSNLWIKQMNRNQAGNRTILEGVAEGFQPISDLMKSMEQSGRFGGVQLVKAERNMLGTRPMIYFTVSAGWGVNGPPAAPAPVPEGKS